MVPVRDVKSFLDGQYPPHAAESWDAVGTIAGDLAAPVERILFAVDPVQAVVDEAVREGVQMVVTHHPLFLRGTTQVSTATPKGRVVHTLISQGIALHNCHTNADIARHGVSESMALAFGLTDVRPLVPSGAELDGVGHGRIGELPEPMPLAHFAEHVQSRLPATGGGIRVAGDLDREIRTVALCGGAGDSFLDEAQASGADVYVTSDLRHHPASEFLEHADAGALIDVPHWAAEWTWLPVVAGLVHEALGLQTVVSRTVTDPWSATLVRPN